MKKYIYMILTILFCLLWINLFTKGLILIKNIFIGSIIFTLGITGITLFLLQSVLVLGLGLIGIFILIYIIKKGIKSMKI